MVLLYRASQTGRKMSKFFGSISGIPSGPARQRTSAAIDGEDRALDQHEARQCGGQAQTARRGGQRNRHDASRKNVPDDGVQQFDSQ